MVACVRVCILDLVLTPHFRPWEGKLRLGTNPLLLSAFWFGRKPAVRMQLYSFQLFIVPANV